jgi:hypothetical protein
VAVSFIVWLDGLFGCSLKPDIARVFGRYVNMRVVIESVKLMFTVITFGELKIARVSGMESLVSCDAGAM